MNILNLNNNQKILFFSSMCAISVQIFCIFYFFDINKKFNYNCCTGYLFFSALAYICYYKLILP